MSSSIERDNELIAKATEPLVGRVKELEALLRSVQEIAREAYRLTDEMSTANKTMIIHNTIEQALEAKGDE